MKKISSIIIIAIMFFSVVLISPKIKADESTNYILEMDGITIDTSISDLLITKVNNKDYTIGHIPLRTNSFTGNNYINISIPTNFEIEFVTPEWYTQPSLLYDHDVKIEMAYTEQQNEWDISINNKNDESLFWDIVSEHSFEIIIRNKDNLFFNNESLKTDEFMMASSSNITTNKGTYDWRDIYIDGVLDVDFTAEIESYFYLGNTKYLLNIGDNLKINTVQYQTQTVTINDELITDNTYPDITGVILKDIHDSVVSDLESLAVTRSYRTDADGDFIETLSLRFDKSDLLWEENKEYTINIPEGYLAYAMFETKHLALDDDIKISAWGYSAWRVTVGDYLHTSNLGKSFTIFLIPDTHTSVHIYKQHTNTVTHYYNNVVRKGNIILNEDILSMKDDLDEHLTYNYFYDAEHTLPVGLTDIATTDNIQIHRTYAFSENDNLYVTFDTGGGTEIPTQSYSRTELGYTPGYGYAYLNDINFELPPDPIKNGYIFNGWILNGIDYVEGVNRSTQTNFDFVAKWVDENTVFNVTFNFRFGILDPVVIEVNAGKLINQSIIPNHPKTFMNFGIGYRFVDWSLYGSDILYDFNQKIMSDVTLTAYAEKIEHLNVNFVTNGGVYLAPIKIKYRYSNSKSVEFAKNLPIPEKSKAIFAGWFIDEELTIPAPTNVRNDTEADMIYYDVTVYANWIENSVLVRFVTNTPNLALSPVVITKGDFINISNPPKRPGYIFNGWFFDIEETVEYKGEALTEDEVTLYASWLYDGDGSEGDDASDDDASVFGKSEIIIVVSIVGVIVLLSTIKKKKKRKKW